jgi:PIN domain nuclease of toxin-antitoxin system
MNYLVDTHVFLWMLAEPAQLLPEVARVLTHPDHTVFVSAVTAVEISIKAALGKLEAPFNLQEEIALRGLSELPIRYAHGAALRDLPNHHADPFDRMMIAQAVVENLKVVTRDRKFEPYPVSILWT